MVTSSDLADFRRFSKLHEERSLTTNISAPFEYVYPQHFPAIANFGEIGRKRVVVLGATPADPCTSHRQVLKCVWLVCVHALRHCGHQTAVTSGFLVQWKRNLDKKFQKNLVEFGGLPPDPLESHHKATPRVSYEPSGPLLQWKNPVDITSGFAETTAVDFLMQNSVKIFK